MSAKKPSSANGLLGAGGVMNLKEAFLCIGCDEVFVIGGSPCNPRCPRCASSVFVPLSAWVQTRAAFDHALEKEVRPRLEIIHPTPIAA
jgi:hypothetical protein